MKYLVTIIVIILFSSSMYVVYAEDPSIPSSIIATQNGKDHIIDIIIDKENVRQLHFNTNFLKDSFCLDFIVSVPVNTSPQEMKLEFDKELFGNWFAIYSRYSNVSPTDQAAINLDSSFSPLPSLTNNCESTATDMWDDMQIIQTQDNNIITFTIPNHHEDTSEYVNNLEIHVKGEHYGVDANNLVAKNVFPYTGQKLSSGGEISSFALTGIFSEKTIISRDFFDAKTDFSVYDGDTLVEHKLTDSPTHRIIELPNKVNDVIIYGDTVGHNTNLRKINLSSEQLFRTWYVGVIGEEPVSRYGSDTGIVCGDRLCSEIESDDGTLRGDISWDTEYAPVFDAAFEYWETRIPGLELNQVIPTSSSDFNVKWVTHTAGDRLGHYSFSPRKVAAPIVEVTNGYMDDGELIKLDKDYVTQLLTHEIGHALGFEHILDDEDVMFAYIYNYGDWQNTLKIYNPTKCKDCLRFISPENIEQKEAAVPKWIQQNAKWWADGEITDSDFVNGIQYLIKEKIIQVDASQNADSSLDEIPEWFKINFGLWADGQLDDETFLFGIKFLIEKGIIQVQSIR